MNPRILSCFLQESLAFLSDKSSREEFHPNCFCHKSLSLQAEIVRGTHPVLFFVFFFFFFFLESEFPILLQEYRVHEAHYIGIQGNFLRTELLRWNQSLLFPYATQLPFLGKILNWAESCLCATSCWYGNTHNSK